ncbi:CD1247 N-terminal domain-containing protein [Desulfotomaculum copahuensis]|uniref:AraC family transcriptional regulator n=1 Tax=Desulfotomaculum copahuensis TaxID=1838280 RepID=A0A1B7LBK3_9FIRM|nr:CD1247 N-terminal domain-containing protein [Desulfotomaculum copahuensis]OAT79848.1 AraC family transcriptional regulator [Desulfotomaculum copahuensis]
MEDLRSRVAYLQGLSAGMDLSPESKEGRLLGGIIDVLNDFADSFGRLEEAHGQLEDYLESIDEDLYTLEDEIYDQDDDQEQAEYMEVKCPRCGETVCFDAGIVEDDDVIEVTCPNCDEVVFINDDRFEAADEPEMLEGRACGGEEEDDI